MADHQRFNIKSLSDLINLSDHLNLDIPISEDLDILFQAINIGDKTVPNRLAVQPMEGFDSLNDGSPGELTFRRYKRYARGGSGMIWFEACSVMLDGRSNPHQLMISRSTLDGFKRLVDDTRDTALGASGSSNIPYLVLQLTHSGRYSKPEGKPLGKYFTKNKYLDPNSICSSLFSDNEIENIRDKYFEAMLLAEEAGFDAVDLKISHGYLLHEIMVSYERKDSRFGGDYENRMSFIRELAGFQTKIEKSIRLNATDMIPYPYGYGMKTDGSMVTDLSEPFSLIKELGGEVPLWNITAGIPYYNPYINRPYDKGLKGSPIPPEHPLEGVSRLINLAGEIQLKFPHLPIVGTAYSWLRQFYPYVGAGVLKSGKASFIGLGRSAFAYPDATKDLLNKGYLDPKKVCVSCSQCTQFMRNGVPSGCAIRDKDLYKINR